MAREFLHAVDDILDAIAGSITHIRNKFDTTGPSK